MSQIGSMAVPIQPVPALFPLPWVPLPCNPLPPTCSFRQWWWIMEKFLKYPTPCACWRHSQCCHQAAVWSLAALIEARKQWQINGVGREVVDFQQRGLWKPFVSWAEEIRSEKDLRVLNLRLLVPEGTSKGLYSYIYIPAARQGAPDLFQRE